MTVLMSFFLVGFIFGILDIKSDFVLMSLVIITAFPIGIFVVSTSDYLFGRYYEGNK